MADRAKIGLAAIIGAGIYGTVTDIAYKYDISRPFVYELKDMVIDTFGVSANEGKNSDLKYAEFADKLILATRLCCKSSLGGISETLKILGLPHSSIGYISGFLNLKASFAVDDSGCTGAGPRWTAEFVVTGIEVAGPVQ